MWIICLLILAISCRALCSKPLEVSTDILERDFGLFPRENLAGSHSLMISSSNPVPLPELERIGENFNVLFRCERAFTYDCGTFRKAMEKAFTILEQELVISRPINVGVKVIISDLHDLLRRMPGSLGVTSPVNRIIGKRTIFQNGTTVLLDEVPIAFPKPLVKQWPVDGKQFSREGLDIDWYTYIDASRDWFIVENGSTVPENKFDLVGVFLHEFMHGLGFSESFSPAKLVPKCYMPVSDLIMFSNDQVFFVDQWRKLSAYENHIQFHDQTWVRDYYTQFESRINIKKHFGNENIPGKQVIEDFARFGVLETCQRLYDSCNGTEARAPTFRSKIYKHHDEVYLSKFSPSHLSHEHYPVDTQAALMVPSVAPGVTILREKDGKFIAPEILTVFEAIGYSTHRIGQNITFELDSIEGVDQNTSFSLSPSLFAWMMLILLWIS